MAEPVRDVDAHHKIDAHEKVCAERYGNLWEAVKRIEAGMVTDRAVRSQHEADTHHRFNTISNRMWTILFSVTGASILGLASLIFFLLTKGQFK